MGRKQNRFFYQDDSRAGTMELKMNILICGKGEVPDERSYIGDANGDLKAAKSNGALFSY